MGDTLGWSYPDPEHSSAGKRWLVIGMSERQRVLVVSYTADADTIRVISARRATRKERNFYEEG